MFTTSDTAIRELDHRSANGIDVTLLWDSQTDEVVVAVEDQRSGDWFTVAVRAADAGHAFHHPYVYREFDRDKRTLTAGLRTGR